MSIFKTFGAPSVENLNSVITEFAKSNNLREIDRSAPSICKLSDETIFFSVTSTFERKNFSAFTEDLETKADADTSEDENSNGYDIFAKNFPKWM